MRLNSESPLRMFISVYLNGVKEPEAVEVFVPGNALEGKGYVIRGVTKNGKSVAARDMPQPLAAGLYDCEGLLCEKVFGQIRIAIEESKSLFGEDN